MKRLGLLFIQFLIVLVLQACRGQENWNTLTIHGSSLNPDVLAYSFQYPSTWVGRSDKYQVTLASEESLLMNVPEQLDAGQIIVNLSVNTDALPEDMLEMYVSTLQSSVAFEDSVPYELNDRPAAYKEGAYAESGDQIFIIAVDIGENMRGLLTSRTAEGELRDWRKTLLKIAESWRANP
jgi:hypothetical protein